MKYFSSILFIFMLISSCKKTGSATLSVAGNWELRESIGGFAGDLKYAAGNGNILELNSNMTFKMIYPSTLNTTGTYQVINVFPGNNLLHLNFDSTSYIDITDSLKIEGDKLILSRKQQCCDIPYESVYEKIN